VRPKALVCPRLHDGITDYLVQGPFAGGIVSSTSPSISVLYGDGPDLLSLLLLPRNFIRRYTCAATRHRRGNSGCSAASCNPHWSRSSSARSLESQVSTVHPSSGPEKQNYFPHKLEHGCLNLISQQSRSESIWTIPDILSPAHQHRSLRKTISYRIR
jgi:hypothetical protein